MQAQVESGVPRCFTECKAVRERNKCTEQRDKCKLRVAKLEEDLGKAQKALDDEKAVLQRHEERLKRLNAKVAEMAVPSPGKGWGAAVVFLEQAAKCLQEPGTDGNSQNDKLQEALVHAQQQHKQEEEKAAQAAKAKQAADEAERLRAKEEANSQVQALGGAQSATRAPTP